MNWDILSPGYTIIIRTEAQQKLLTKVLIAKIAVQVLVVAGLLAMGGLSREKILLVLIIATIWQGICTWRRRLEDSRNQAI